MVDTLLITWFVIQQCMFDIRFEIITGGFQGK